MPEVVKFEKPNEITVDPCGFVRTQTAEEILRSLVFVRSINGPAITLISGASGIGKTETLLHYERRNWDTSIYVSVAKGEGNPFHIASQILEKFRYDEVRGKGLGELRQVAGQFIGSQRILLVDEAQNLFQKHKLSGTKGSSFGWLVAASDAGGFDLALCGDLSLQSIITQFPGLLSRVRQPVFIKATSQSDIAAIAASEGLFEAAELNLLSSIAALPGGLRNVDNVLRMAALFAGKDRITAGHLKAAIQDLKLQPLGRK